MATLGCISTLFRCFKRMSQRVMLRDAKGGARGDPFPGNKWQDSLIQTAEPDRMLDITACFKQDWQANKKRTLHIQTSILGGFLP